MNLMRKLAEEASGRTTPEPQRQPESLVNQNFRNQMASSAPISSTMPGSSVSTNLSSTEDGNEYSSPKLTHRRYANVAETELM